MEENRTSESVVVLPDVSEPSTSETQEASTLIGDHKAHPAAVMTNGSSVSGVTGVPGTEVPFFLSTSPVRSSTPRRKINLEVSDGEAPSYKYESDNSIDESNNHESDNKVVVPDKDVWPQLVSMDGLVVQQSQQQDTVTQNVHQIENRQNDIFKKLDEICNKMLELALEFKTTLEEAKELNRQQRREQALATQPGARGGLRETIVCSQPEILTTKRKDTKKNASEEQRDSDIDC
ncbi:uncharacterized protein LOC107271637 [Cephus cinctus]|uniref:Uncharacterized protein LOC107271637 n=1 Tax=Cephus cinctus TaxID=211228 RepID=A0AAJ7FQJ0_CEPCN|nr:uncharacterized protein LOC107271637 [Cephus cinctus]